MEKYGTCGCVLTQADGNGKGNLLRVKAVDKADNPVIEEETYCNACTTRYQINGMVLKDLKAEATYLAG